MQHIRIQTSAIGLTDGASVWVDIGPSKPVSSKGEKEPAEPDEIGHVHNVLYLVFKAYLQPTAIQVLEVYHTL
jgi:hypothetical protein